MGQKLKIDYNSLTFKDAESKTWRLIKTITAHLIGILFVGIIVFIFLSTIIKSPEEQKLAYENKRLKEEYSILTQKLEQSRKIYNKIKEENILLYKLIFQSDPPQDSRPDYSETFKNKTYRQILAEDNEKLDELLKSAKETNKEFEQLLQNAVSEHNKLRHIPSVLPVPAEFLNKGVFGFGMKIDPFYKTVKAHKGIDFSVPEKTPVFATADGTVTSSLPDKRYGINIKINHGNGFYTVYANLNAKKVSVGQRVKAGDLIGFAGNTGKSFTSHLHYEVIYKKQRLDPLYFFFGSISPKIFIFLYKENQKGGISMD